MRRSTGIILAAGVCAAIALASLVSAEPLTLSRAAALARTHSPQILEGRARNQAALEARREARAARLPSLEVSEMALRTNAPADVFGLRLTQERFSFPAFTAADPNRPDPLDHYATQVRASLPLFTGGRLSAGIRQADLMSQAAGAMSRHAESAVGLAVANAYMDALLADEARALAERARSAVARHVEQAQSFFDAGMIVESDLLQARVELARMDENLLRAENNASLARAGLNRAMGVEQETGFDLEPVLPALDPEDGSFDEALARAFSARADLRAARAQAGTAAAAVQMAGAERWPEVAVVGSYSMSDDVPFGSHGGSYSLSAMARWTLWNWGRTGARLSRSRGEAAAAGEQERSERQRVEFEVRQAWQSVEESRARLEVASRSVSFAERAHAILEDRFTQGVARITDLLDAETSEHDARLRESQARFDVQRSLRTLRYATGSDPVPEAAR